MTIIKSGEVSWTDESNDGDRKTNNKDIWLRLDKGENEVRLVTQPFQYLVHKFKKDGDPGFGTKVYCSAANGSCALCDMAEAAATTEEKSKIKAKKRWLLGVISRKTQTYKILDISWAVFGSIQKLAKNPKFGDPCKYDINIQVDPNGGATGYYTVQGYGKEPLSAADQAIKDNYMDLDDLKRRITPPTPDKVLERMAKIIGAPLSTIAETVKAATVKPQVSETAADTSELDSDFPDYSETQASQ